MFWQLKVTIEGRVDGTMKGTAAAASNLCSEWQRERGRGSGSTVTAAGVDKATDGWTDGGRGSHVE